MADETSTGEIIPQHLLGDLESAIMEIVWAQGETTVRTVQAALKPERPLAYTTVMTVMGRLAQKGVLYTRKHGKTYYYRAAQATPGAFVTERAQQAVQDLIANYGDVAIAQFLHAIDGVTPERLAALRALIEQESPDAP